MNLRAMQPLGAVTHSPEQYHPKCQVLNPALRVQSTLKVRNSHVLWCSFFAVMLRNQIRKQHCKKVASWTHTNYQPLVNPSLPFPRIPLSLLQSSYLDSYDTNAGHVCNDIVFTHLVPIGFPRVWIIFDLVLVSFSRHKVPVGQGDGSQAVLGHGLDHILQRNQIKKTFLIEYSSECFRIFGNVSFRGIERFVTPFVVSNTSF